MRTPGLACDSSASCRNEGPEAPRAAGSAGQIRLDPMNRCVALRRRTRRVGVGPIRSHFDGRPQWHSVPASHGMIWMGCCLSAKLRGCWRPWPTAKRHFDVRMGRPFAASGACADRTWRAIRAINMWVRPPRCCEPPRSGGKVRDHRMDDLWRFVLPSDGRRNPAGMRPTLCGEATRFLPLMR